MVRKSSEASGRASLDRVVMLTLLAVATAIASMGLAAGGTAGALLGANIAGTVAAAGLPLGVLVIGSAISAPVISWGAGRVGRVRGLAAGYVVGGLGAAIVVAAAAVGSLAGLLTGSFLLGAANASIFLTRYSAARIVSEALRGRALGTIFFASAIGAVASPSLLAPTGRLAEILSLPPLTGLYLVGIVTFMTAGAVLLVASGPSVGHLVQAANVLRSNESGAVDLKAITAGLRRRAPRMGLVALAASNMIMVSAMAVAPVHLRSHGYGLQLIGTIVSIHVAGMLAPAPISGWIADRIGPTAVAASGFALLAAAGVGGAIANQHSALAITLILGTIGIGWNFGVVGGSTIVATEVPAAVRPHVEGIGEAAMGLAAAVGAPTAGILATIGGFPALLSSAAMIALFALAFIGWSIRRPATPMRRSMSSG